MTETSWGTCGGCRHKPRCPLFLESKDTKSTCASWTPAKIARIQKANSTKTRKAKGRRFQQQIRNDLIKVLGIDPVDIVSTPMGCAGCDIALSAAAREKWPFGGECKNAETINFWKAWGQARTNADKEGLNPILFVHKNDSEVLCVLPWDLMKKMLKKGD